MLHATPIPAKQKTPPEATWGIRILVVWSKTAREQLITNTHLGLNKFNKTYHQRQYYIFKGTIPFLDPQTDRILPRMATI
jgi:hypothetical protein